MASQTIWGATDRGPVTETMRIPVDINSSSTPGYITPAEMQTFLGSITRSINSVSGTTSAGSTAQTDYVYLCTGTFTITLPTAVSNKNLYTIKNVGTGVITVATTSAQTIDGASTWVISNNYDSINAVSDNANFNIV